MKPRDQVTVIAGPHAGRSGKIIKSEMPGRGGKKVYRVTLNGHNGGIFTRRIAADNLAKGD